MNPKIVVAGQECRRPDLPGSVGASQQYLRDFSHIVDESGTVEQVMAEMLKLHGDRDNPRTYRRREKRIAARHAGKSRSGVTSLWHLEFIADGDTPTL